MRVAFSVACFFVALSPAPASAQATADPFTLAETAYAGAELDTALTHYEAAWHEGIEDPARLALVHLRMGTLHAMLGRADDARRHFGVAVTLDPTLETPPELPPPLQALFVEAVEARAPYEVRAEVLDPGPPTQLRVTASASLDDVAEQLSVAVGEDAPETAAADAPFEIRVPLGRFAEQEALVVVARALDGHGGVLSVTELEVARPVPEVAVAFPDLPSPAPLPRPTPEPEDDGGLLASPWFWLTSALVVLAIGGLTVGLAVGLGQDVYDFGPPTVSR
ncbi:MAG: hypothetical protein AB8I08_37410 [Sandaracinaceae bacterium]